MRAADAAFSIPRIRASANRPVGTPPLLGGVIFRARVVSAGLPPSSTVLSARLIPWITGDCIYQEIAALADDGGVGATGLYRAAWPILDMSITASESLGDRNIWAYDVALTILLTDAAVLMDGLADSLAQDLAHDHQQPRSPWLRSVAAELRVHATVGADRRGHACAEATLDGYGHRT
jgi:hypothetical protein